MLLKIGLKIYEPTSDDPVLISIHKSTTTICALYAEIYEKRRFTVAFAFFGFDFPRIAPPPGPPPGPPIGPRAFPGADALL